MASAGDIPALIRGLRGSSRAAQLQAATALGQLARASPEHCQDIAAAGAIPPLEQLLCESSSEAVQLAAARALRPLAECSMREAVSAGAIPALMLLLQSNRTEVVEEACCALLAMLTNDDYRTEHSQALVATVGAIPALVRHLGSDSKVLRRVAAAMLYDLCQMQGTTADAGIAAGGIPALVEVLP